MTVDELIRELGNFRGDLPVVLNMGKNELANGCEVCEVTVLQAVRWPASDQWSLDYYARCDDDYCYADVVNLTPKHEVAQ